MKLFAYNLIELMLCEHHRNFVDRLSVECLDDASLLDIAEQCDLRSDIVVKLHLGTTQEDVRSNTEFHECLH